MRPLRAWSTALRPWFQHLVVSSLILVLLAALTEPEHVPEKLLWHTFLAFLILLCMLAIAVPIFGIMVIYHRIRLYRLRLQMRSEYGD